MGELAVVAKACLHQWEEPCISGTRGSGTVFFSGCNLSCVFCQNSAISQECYGKEVTADRLADIYLELQDKGAHNINLVNPTHFTARIKESLLKAEGLKIPVVYNSNGYERLESLKEMEGLINVFLPDLKYYNGDTAAKYSGAADYFRFASAAVAEMYKQVGDVELDGEGIIKKGLIIRHLILPGMAAESLKVLDWIKGNLPSTVTISLMSQYTPYYKASGHPEIGRRITRREYERVVEHFFKLGFENGYVQERESAEEDYIPEFNLEGVDPASTEI